MEKIMRMPGFEIEDLGVQGQAPDLVSSDQLPGPCFRGRRPRVVPSSRVKYMIERAEYFALLTKKNARDPIADLYANIAGGAAIDALRVVAQDHPELEEDIEIKFGKL